jgi:hypothetical protein
MNRRRFCAAAGLALAPAALAAQPAGQPVGPHAQPDHIPLGTLRVGATAEASIRVFAEGDKATALGPPFVVVKDVTKDNMNGKACCDVTFVIDTARAGDFAGDIVVGVGKNTLLVPVRATVRADEPGLTRVLVAGIPFSKFSTSDGAMFGAWTKIVDAGKLNPSYLLVDRGRPVLRDRDLSRFDVVLLGDEGMVFVTDADVKRLHTFVEAGGRVVLTADHFMRGTVDGANQVMAPYGLRMDDMEPAGVPGKTWEVTGDGLRADALTDGVRSVSFFRPSPITAQGGATNLAAAEPYPGQGFAAVARAGKGDVAVVGQSLWWSWITAERSKGADNARLLQNLLTRPRTANVK